MPDILKASIGDASSVRRLIDEFEPVLPTSKINALSVNADAGWCLKGLQTTGRTQAQGRSTSAPTLTRLRSTQVGPGWLIGAGPALREYQGSAEATSAIKPDGDESEKGETDEHAELFALCRW